MRFFEKLKSVFKRPELILLKLARRGLIKISDRKYIELNYLEIFGRKPDLENPRTFSEKINWIKLHRTGRKYSELVNKISVKDIVREKIGEDYVVPTYGVFDKFDDIDFDALPDKFVIKCNHDSGGLVICEDKKKLDMDKARKKIEQSLCRNFYYDSREPIYKNIQPKILVEKYLAKNIRDYKFYCFNGEPKYLYVSEGLENHATAHIQFFNLDFSSAPFQRTDYKLFDKPPQKPENLDDMIKIARKLATGFDFVRIDLYDVDGQIYFSEYTFTPCSGMMPISPSKYDLVLGEMLKLEDGKK